MKTVEETPKVVRKIEGQVTTLAEKARANEISVKSLHRKLDRIIEGRLHERRSFEDEDED